MRIDVVLVSLLCIMIGSTVIARAQQSRVSRVLIIMAEKPYYAPPQITGLRDRLNELGYIEGRNVIYDLLQEENDDALRASFRTFVQKNVDVIVAVGQVEAAIASELTGKIPIVFMPAGDPVGTKLVRSLATPGTNLTGLTYMEPKAIAKQVEVFKEFIPSLRQVVLLIDNRKGNLTNAESLRLIRKVAGSLHLNLVETPVKSLGENRACSFRAAHKHYDRCFSCLRLFIPRGRETLLPLLYRRNSRCSDVVLVRRVTKAYC